MKENLIRSLNIAGYNISMPLYCLETIYMRTNISHKKKSQYYNNTKPLYTRVQIIFLVYPPKQRTLTDKILRVALYVHG